MVYLISSPYIIMVQIKWICPTAPTMPVALFGGFPCTACKIYSFKP